MKKIYLLSSLFGVFGLALLGSAQAAVVHISEDPGTVVYYDSISTWITSGQDMTGMEVTVNYVSSSETVSWDVGGAGTGAVGSDWSLTMADPTKTTYYGSYWTFDVMDGGDAIESIFLNGVADNTIFDNRKPLVPGDQGTDGSWYGNPLTIDLDYGGMPVTTYSGDINVSYIGDIALTNNPVVGDIYQSMLIEFGGNAFASSDEFYFYQDTDNIVDPVPEPATMFLFGVGLTGLVAVQSRRKRR